MQEIILKEDGKDHLSEFLKALPKSLKILIFFLNSNPVRIFQAQWQLKKCQRYSRFTRRECVDSIQGIENGNAWPANL